MEFTYKFTDKETREAFWLRYWNLPRKILFVLIGVTAVVCLIAMIVQVKNEFLLGYGLSDSLMSDAVFPMIVVLCVCLIITGLALILQPWMVVRRTRKDPIRQTSLHVNISPQGIQVRAGELGSSNFNWTVYKSWREGVNVLVLRGRSGLYQPLVVKGLSESEREELRGILASVLPKK